MCYYVCTCYLYLSSCFCYGFIWLKVWRRKLPGEGIHNNELVHRSKIKVIKILFVVVMVFIGSWLPLYAIFTRIKVGAPYPENSMEEFITQVFAPVARWLGASNSCINAVLYEFFNAKLRAGFKAVLFGKKPCCSTNGGNMVQMSSRKTTSARFLTGNLSKKGSAKENAI
ncbi:neuropeptide SIFamide receptor [Caerostris darwini]|uniref:Neuropeptide SIFamide receptor n=1 Tax=Caerostris darwini TaxID=1538125 RepID=A0AAV4S7F1_9ARAC|nr:neuropeptide SIFamide receptor [Caerostris darwini]